jgi:hypothetical protein
VARVLGVVTAATLVDIAEFDLAAGELLGVLDDVLECMPVIGIVGRSPGSTNSPPGARALVVPTETLTPNS